MTSEIKSVSREDEVAQVQSRRLFAPTIKAMQIFSDQEHKNVCDTIFHAGAALAAAVASQAIEKSVMDTHTIAFIEAVEKAEKPEEMRPALDKFLINTKEVISSCLDTALEKLQVKVQQGDFSAQHKNLILERLQKIYATAVQMPIVTIMGLGEFWAYLEADYSGSVAKAKDMERAMENLQAELQAVLTQLEGK